MRKRQGFTLVELLVVMALVILIMVILAQAFGRTIESLQKAKGIGDMQDKLRAASTIIRRDLAADHFEGRRRVSDVAGSYLPAREGFFQIVSDGGAGRTFEGNDPYGIPSNIVTQRQLRMTVKLRKNDRDRFFSAQIPSGSPLLGASTNYFGLPSDARFQDSANTYNSQWAEICYFMVPTGYRAGNTTLFGLYRSQLALVADNAQINSMVPAADIARYSEFSVSPSRGANLYFNTPTDVTTGGAWNQTNSAKSLLLNDVISFEIVGWQRLYKANGDPRANQGPWLPGFNFRLYNDPAFTPILDFLSSTSSSPKLDGIFITIRIWDAKTQQARQMTIFQDL